MFFVVEPDFCVLEEDEQARNELQTALKTESLQATSLEEMPGIIGDDELKEDFKAKYEKYKADKAAAGRDEEALWPFTAGDSSGSIGDRPRPSKKPLAGLESKAAPPRKRTYSGERCVPAPKKPTKPKSMAAEDLSLIHI